MHSQSSHCEHAVWRAKKNTKVLRRDKNARGLCRRSRTFSTGGGAEGSHRRTRDSNLTNNRLGLKTLLRLFPFVHRCGYARPTSHLFIVQMREGHAARRRTSAYSLRSSARCTFSSESVRYVPTAHRGPVDVFLRNCVFSERGRALMAVPPVSERTLRLRALCFWHISTWVVVFWLTACWA